MKQASVNTSILIGKSATNSELHPRTCDAFWEGLCREIGANAGTEFESKALTIIEAYRASTSPTQNPQSHPQDAATFVPGCPNFLPLDFEHFYWDRQWFDDALSELWLD
jgi:hypothetical protein